MKKLPPGGNLIIPSNLPRTRRGPDSRGIRICFSELGRSCHLQQAFLIFTDGSAYAYDAPSNMTAEALCEQLQRGRVFNFAYRLSRGGYVRGFTPPADYETIYSFPPYAGVAPAACPLGVPDWTLTDWTVTTNSPSPGQSMVFTLDPGTGDTQDGAFTCAVTSINGQYNTHGDLTFNGVMTNCRATLLVTGANSDFHYSLEIIAGQDGSAIGDLLASGSGNTTRVLNFTVADTGGIDSDLTLDLLLTINTTGLGSDATVSLHAENV